MGSPPPKKEGLQKWIKFQKLKWRYQRIFKFKQLKEAEERPKRQHSVKNYIDMDEEIENLHQGQKNTRPRKFSKYQLMKSKAPI